MRQYRTPFIITILITLLPCLIGILLWQQLPDQIPTHFDAHNNIDGWSSKTFAVFGLPIILAVMQVLCVFFTIQDPKNKNISKKLLLLIMSIIPVVSIFVYLLSYSAALGYPVNVNIYSNILLGLIFIIIGNYLPKTRQNHTVGIKIPWTLNSEANWQKTHRLAGFVWTFGGTLVLLSSFWQSIVPMLVIVFFMVLIPSVYSFYLYKKHI